VPPTSDAKFGFDSYTRGTLNLFSESTVFQAMTVVQTQASARGKLLEPAR
jgi:hypothetical protein